MVVARQSLTISTGLLLSHLSCIRHLTVDVTLHIWTSIAHCYLIGKSGGRGWKIGPIWCGGNLSQNTDLLKTL